VKIGQIFQWLTGHVLNGDIVRLLDSRKGKSVSCKVGRQCAQWLRSGTRHILGNLRAALSGRSELLKALGAVACSPERQVCILGTYRYQRLSARGLVWHLSVTTVVSHLRGEVPSAYQDQAVVLLRETREKAMPSRFVF
jgi:hypothetical protein